MKKHMGLFEISVDEKMLSFYNEKKVMNVSGYYEAFSCGSLL